MGTQCGSFPLHSPDTTNKCSSDIGDYYDMPDFCTYAGPGGKSYREDWCGQLGAPGEWGVSNDGNGHGSCHYADCKPYVQLGTGCCRGCCGIIGEGVRCVREKFTGDKVQCCYNDNACTTPDGNPPTACFSDPYLKNTCDPKHRDITSSDCGDYMIQYCSGQDIADESDVSWMERWFNPITGEEVCDRKNKKGCCVYALKRQLYKDYKQCDQVDKTIQLIGKTDKCSPNTEHALSASGVEWGQKLMDKVFEKYRKNGFVLGARPGEQGYYPFQDFLYQICCSAPVICQTGLSNTCGIYTAERLSYNPDVANWCGCYLPDGQYADYVNKYQINKECTPMCNRKNSIPIVSGDNTPKPCTQTDCFINNVSIDLINSTVGDVNISQMCGNCQSKVPGGVSSCSCVISDTSIDGANAQIQGININEACSSTKCRVTNPDPNGSPAYIEIPCDQAGSSDAFGNANSELLKKEQEKKRTRNVIIIIVAILILALFFLAILFIRPSTSGVNAGLRELGLNPDGSPMYNKTVYNPPETHIVAMHYA